MTKAKESSLTQQNSEILAAPSSVRTSFYNTIESERYVNGWYITTWKTWEVYDLISLRDSDCESYILTIDGADTGYASAGLSNSNTYSGSYSGPGGPQCSIQLPLPIVDGQCIIPKGYIDTYRYLQLLVGVGSHNGSENKNSWLPGDNRDNYHGYKANLNLIYRMAENMEVWE